MKTADKANKWITVVIFGGLMALTVRITLFVPADRNIGLIFRQKLFILPVVFLLAFAAAAVKNRYLKAVIYPLLFGVFLLPLMGLWNSGSSSQYIFAGTIPWSDAFIHHLNTLRFLFGGTMEQSSAIRPLALTFNALILYLTNNNGFVLYGLTAMLIAASVLINLPLIAAQFGPAAAALFFTNAFFFIRPYLGSFMTEPYGFAVGMLSCFLLVRGMLSRKPVLIITGFLALSLALNIRPSAMFVLATSGIWFFFHYLRNNQRRFLFAALALCAMLAGFALSKLNTYLVAPAGQRVTNDQAALYIYGICMGGRDTYYAMAQPELTSLFGTNNLWQGVWNICQTELTSHPENFWSALRIIWDALLLDPERGAYSYFDGARNGIVQAVRFSLMALWVVGLGFAWRKRHNHLYSFLLMMVLGILLFQFVAPAYNYYRMRFDAPVNWVSGLISAIGLQFLINRILQKKELIVPSCNESQSFFGITSFAVAGICFSVAIAIVAPALIKALPIQTPEPPPITCEKDETLVYTRIDPANAAFLQSYDLKQPHAPDFHLLYVRPRIHDTSSREIFDFIDSFDTPIAIIKGIDLNTYKDILIFADLELLEREQGYVQVCGKIFDPPLYHRYQFMVASAFSFLDASQ